jgi:hypothetical protein
MDWERPATENAKQKNSCRSWGLQLLLLFFFFFFLSWAEGSVNKVEFCNWKKGTNQEEVFYKE